LCLKHALRRSLQWADAWYGGVGFTLTYSIVKLLGLNVTQPTDLEGMLEVFFLFLVTIFFARLITAPYFLWKEQRKSIANLEAAKTNLEFALSAKSDDGSWPTSRSYLYQRYPYLNNVIEALANHSVLGEKLKARTPPPDKHQLYDLIAKEIAMAALNGQLIIKASAKGELEHRPIPLDLWRMATLAAIRHRRGIDVYIEPTIAGRLAPGGPPVLTQEDRDRIAPHIQFGSPLSADAREIERLWPRLEADVAR
jgi:hypothetical protein